MIELYYWTTPNGHKPVIFLEEVGIPYKIHPVNITKGEQLRPEYLKISPGNKIPAIIDTEPTDNQGPLTVFESGAILCYLAEKTQKLCPLNQRLKIEVLEWLFWQIGGLGPMAGQNSHFNVFATEKVPYAMDRYKKETHRLFGVLDKHLKNREWIAANEYSIADIAIYPWIAPFEMLGQDLNDFPALKAWFTHMSHRPAVKRAYEIATKFN